MTNLMKDIGKFDQLFWKKRNEIPMAYHEINSRWTSESQLGNPEEDISEGLISGGEHPPKDLPKGLLHAKPYVST